MLLLFVYFFFPHLVSFYSASVALFYLLLVTDSVFFDSLCNSVFKSCSWFFGLFFAIFLSFSCRFSDIGLFLRYNMLNILFFGVNLHKKTDGNIHLFLTFLNLNQILNLSSSAFAAAAASALPASGKPKTSDITPIKLPVPERRPDNFFTESSVFSSANSG